MKLGTKNEPPSEGRRVKSCDGCDWPLGDLPGRDGRFVCFRCREIEAKARDKRAPKPMPASLRRKASRGT